MAAREATGRKEAGGKFILRKGTMMKKTLMMMALAAVFGIGAGCDNNDGSAERAGERMDRDMERVRDKVEDAGEKTSDKLKDAGEKVEDAARDVKNDIKN